MPVRDRDLQLAAPLHRVACVDQEVQHSVLSAGGIDIGGPKRLNCVKFDLHPLA